MPPDPKPRPREPFTTEEVTKILAACQTFGKGPYERLRAHAMVLLMRRYALRISDVAIMERDRIRNGEIFINAMKNGASLWLPLSDDVKRALERVPFPAGAGAYCKYYFWSGFGLVEEHVKTVGRTLQAVF